MDYSGQKKTLCEDGYLSNAAGGDTIQVGWVTTK